MIQKISAVKIYIFTEVEYCFGSLMLSCNINIQNLSFNFPLCVNLFQLLAISQQTQFNALSFLTVGRITLYINIKLFLSAKQFVFMLHTIQGSASQQSNLLFFSRDQEYRSQRLVFMQLRQRKDCHRGDIAAGAGLAVSLKLALIHLFLFLFFFLQH